MKVYKTNTLSDSNEHILDPDYQHFEHVAERSLHNYFKQLTIPHSVIYLIGIYIQFDIDKFVYENNHELYQKFSDRIQDKIKLYLDFGNAELLDTSTNIFFVTMFDVLEDSLVLACLELYKDFNKRTFLDKTLSIHTGIYFSNSKVNAHIFYQMSKEQFQNTLNHDSSLVSVKYLSPIK